MRIAEFEFLLKFRHRVEMNSKFDIYTAEKCSLSEPRFSRLCAADPVIRLIGNQAVIDGSGSLATGLSQLEALWMVKVLRRMGIDAYPVPEAYRSSRVSALEALEVAREFLLEKREANPEDAYAELEEIQLSWWLSRIAYGFFSRSKEMMRQGIAPAGITACIDRFTGLILRERDLINAELPRMLTE